MVELFYNIIRIQKAGEIMNIDIQQFEGLSPSEIENILIYDYGYPYSEAYTKAREIFEALTEENAQFDIISTDKF